MIPEYGYKTWVETETDVRAYLQNLRHAIDHGAHISFQQDRRVDMRRELRYTNKFTVADLFPDEDPLCALKRVLRELTVEEYIRTVKDLRFPSRSDMREFGRVYRGKGDVYIKIRVELLSENGSHSAFVMSFHYAERPFEDEMFPHRRNEG